MTDDPVRITILGATGTVGKAALKVIDCHPNKFKIVGLSCWLNLIDMKLLVDKYQPEAIGACTISRSEENDLKNNLGATTRFYEGADGIIEMARDPGTDVVIVAIAGSAGLYPILSSINASKMTLIANKEPLIMLGPLIMQEVKKCGSKILPLDSEHNAIFQCLPSDLQKDVSSANLSSKNHFIKYAGIRKITLTASGGPFLKTPVERMQNITVEQATKHPNWVMGKKISIDSATMMNKGLELIEACVLFGLEECFVDVLVHPQSIIHSFITFSDRSIIAQLSKADMRVPIAFALGFANRIESGVDDLDLTEIGSLSFELPDLMKFPCLKIAREVAKKGQNYPTILNASNEIAVDLFIKGEVNFLEIPEIIEEVLSLDIPVSAVSLEDVMLIDKCTRESTKRIAQKRQSQKSKTFTVGAEK